MNELKYQRTQYQSARDFEICAQRFARVPLAARGLIELFKCIKKWRRLCEIIWHVPLELKWCLVIVGLRIILLLWSQIWIKMTAHE